MYLSFGRIPMETNDFLLKRIPPNLRAGFVIIGGLMTMVTYGSVYTFGNLLPYLVSYLRWKVDPNMTAGSMIWLQTCMSGIPFAMVIGGVLERKIGGRKAAIIGSTMYTLGVGFTYYSIQHSFAAMLISMGIVASIGGSISYNAILTTSQRWLPDNVGLASGLIVGGYGCGAFILSPLQTTYINPLDYRVNKDGYFTQEDLLQRVPEVFIVMAIFFTILQFTGLSVLGVPEEELNVEQEELVLDHRGLSVTSHLKSSTFILLFISLTCNAFWVQMTSGLYKQYGQQFIVSDLFLSLVGSLASICNALSRITWGIVVDSTSYQSSMITVCALGAALAWLMPTVQLIANDVLFLIVVCAMFSCVGGTFSMFPFITHKCFGKDNFGVVYGFLQCALTVAGIIAALLSQFGLQYLGYNFMFLIMGAAMFTSLVLTAFLHKTELAARVATSFVPIVEDEEEHEQEELVA